MPNAKITVAFGLAALALGACHKDQQQAQNNTTSLDEGVPDNEVAAGNADIETLPADESSTTPSGQLQNGSDNPDVNGLGPSNSE